MEHESEYQQAEYGYCHYCARRLKSSTDIGTAIVGAKDLWCRSPKCKEDAKRWHKAFLDRNGLTIHLNKVIEMKEKRD